MEQHFLDFILAKTGAESVVKTEVIQELWSNYGQIVRIHLHASLFDSVVVKYIDLKAANAHPRGWATAISHERKLKSYEVEINWYSQYNNNLPSSCYTPKCMGVLSLENKHCILLEDLDASGFSLRKEECTIEEAKLGLKWLAQFHAFHLGSPGEGLWEVGTYWHLATRMDELKAIEATEIQDAAAAMDSRLSQTRFSTLVHGDAKLANFCFSQDQKSIAGVDFQYIGKGCGVKDVAYFLGSCLGEKELESSESELLTYYFSVLENEVKKWHSTIEFTSLEKDWKELYAYAWADFTRFLLGWMPTHHKLNGLALQKMASVLEDLK